ncbi:GNAT family N-acetyltransferase [Paenibacillus mendelii]|uniref:GNAT family N-acetyltransferase n=1 Tax=Paenibacillus mendelii TaxID=206163 RepID=A0ABV6JCU0_9BACL|nr:GNAT family N-acetyltransferase [Paenibacillus mendelii]MCQ6562508.1 GNAT family N-acetyltransferase [Paenibacillus mendelii]
MMIRTALPEDAHAAVPLLFEAIGDITYILMGTDDTEKALEAMTFWFSQPANRLSYENCIVIEAEGRVAGALLAYHGSELTALDRPLLDRIASISGESGLSFPQEAMIDEYYLDSIAVDNAFRGQGLGKQLMQAFEEEGAKRGYPRLALIVELGNENAKRLYAAQGYQADGHQLEIAGHLYEHMVKRLP